MGAAQPPQRFPVKTSLAASGVSGCAAFPPQAPTRATAPNAEADSRRLIDEAQDAALQGDHTAVEYRNIRITPVQGSVK